MDKHREKDVDNTNLIFLSNILHKPMPNNQVSEVQNIEICNTAETAEATSIGMFIRNANKESIHIILDLYNQLKKDFDLYRYFFVKTNINFD